MIINDAQTRRLTLMWWTLAAHVLLIIFGYWIPPADGICGLLSRLLIVAETGLLLSAINLLRPRSAVGWVMSLVLVAVILFMFLSMGTDIVKKDLYLDSYSILPYSYCVLLFLPVIPLLRSFVQVNYTLNVIGCIIALVPITLYTDTGIIQFIFETCILGAGFIFLSGKYHARRHFLWATAALFVGLLAATATGRRNLMLTIAIYLLIGGVQFVFGRQIKSSANRLLLLISLAALVFVGIFFYLVNSHGLFSLITTRATENTREYVFLSFGLDMLDAKSLLIGRGMNGTYICPGVAGGDGDENRNIIENGYMMLLLKGGALYLVCYLSIIIYAIVKGFKARNQLLHACAWLLTVQLIDMLPFGLHAFNVKTFMLWMSVALCLDRSLWAKGDDEIQDLLTEPSLRLPPWDRSRTAEAPVR